MHRTMSGHSLDQVSWGGERKCDPKGQPGLRSLWSLFPVWDQGGVNATRLTLSFRWKWHSIHFQLFAFIPLGFKNGINQNVQLKTWKTYFWLSTIFPDQTLLKKQQKNHKPPPFLHSSSDKPHTHIRWWHLPNNISETGGGFPETLHKKGQRGKEVRIEDGFGSQWQRL